MSTSRVLSSLVLLGSVAGCGSYVNGISVVNDTAAPLVVAVDFSSPVRAVVSRDCDVDGSAAQPPVTLTLQPGERACFVGPEGESSDYDLRARVTTIDVRRSAPCLHLSGSAPGVIYVNDGRNAALQKAFHVTEALCPPT